MPAVLLMTHLVSWPFPAMTEWLPVWKITGIFLATFVLEDVATVGAGLLLTAGAISWPAAFISCFFGIWLGDAGLYGLARWGGRTWFERSAFRKHAARVARCEQWFADRGTLILIFSRCFPGTRLPTYLAAGFLRLALPHFLLVTGLAAAAWTGLILWLARIFGARLVPWLAAGQHGGWWLLGLSGALLVVFHLSRRVFGGVDFQRLSARLERWRHWEFWPAWLFYPPVALHCIRLAIKHRSVSVPMAANPGIFSGGMVGESKITMLEELHATSPEFTAEAVLIPTGELAARRQILAKLLARPGFEYPFILKPDVGQRGAGVKLIRTAAHADDYLRRTNTPLVLQRYAPGPFEAGIFYYRFPGEARGTIFSITEKIFPVVTGDGRSTMGELIARDPRARLIAGIYLKRLGARQDEVPPAGEQRKLVEAGNHAQGCIFRDGGRLLTPELAARIDAISQQVGGFFIGRYDLRFASEADLRAGRNFQIIELNGAAAEATSIYDARNSLRSAYRTLFQQWSLVFAIGAENRRRGHAPLPLLQVWKTWRAYHQTAATYPNAD